MLIILLQVGIVALVVAAAIWLVGRLNLGITVQRAEGALLAAALLVLVNGLYLWWLPKDNTMGGLSVLLTMVVMPGATTAVLLLVDRLGLGLKAHSLWWAIVAAWAILFLGGGAAWLVVFFIPTLLT